MTHDHVSAGPEQRNVRIVWWNTGLSPVRDPDRATADDFAAAAAVLLHLVEDLRADLVVLGEMAPSSVQGLREACPTARVGFAWFPAFQTAGKSHFSLCILGRKGRIQVGFRSPLVDKVRGTFVKAGMHFTARLTDDSPPLELIASHWPSRLHMDQRDPERTHIAAFLRDWLDEEHLGPHPDANIVLLGDYNDEPFDDGLERFLLATRDRERVRQNGRLLFNPFWRHLSAFPNDTPDRRLSDPGTYIHRAGKVSGWRTFDQLMVSSALLFGRSGWRLNEEQTRAVPLPASHPGLPVGKLVFDHLPILGTFERIGPSPQKTKADILANVRLTH
jgi:hypothetical protein